MQATENLNIVSFDPMPTPQEIHQRVPLTENAAKSVLAGRRSLEAILDRRDKRRFVVVGPCSIHDPVAGIDYARRLKALADEVSETREATALRILFTLRASPWNRIR